ncbi:hypothetical protein WA538_003729 [Blastocystis sp. DL]
MWKQPRKLVSLLQLYLKTPSRPLDPAHSRIVRFVTTTPSPAPTPVPTPLLQTLPKTVATQSPPVPGQLIDEPTEEKPELYVVPITPPNLSINGNDIGIRPMSLEDFRKKISSFQDSDRWKEFKMDEGVIENERADILADRINDLLSNRKQKFVYKELQKFIMLPSPVDRQTLFRMLRELDKGLDAVSPSLLPWIEAYFNGTEFPEAGEEKKEVQLQLDALTRVTEKFFRDWENVQYDGFQWRVNVVRDCIESYVSDEESTRLYAFFNQFADSPRKASSLAQFLSRVGSILKFNEHSGDLLALIEWVVKGLNEFPLISINAVQSTEVRRRDAERHTLICAYNKYRYHSKTLGRGDAEKEKGALQLAFRLSTLLDDAQHKLLMARLSDYQSSPMSDNDLQAFIRSVCQICGRSAYLVEPSLKEYASYLSIPTLEHVRRMKKPVLTVKAVSRYMRPDANLSDLLQADATPVKRRRRVLTFSSNTPYPLPASTSLYQVFVHNLPRGISTEELARAFRNCGAVNKVEILDYSAPEEKQEKQVARIRQTSAESKIYGFVHFEEKAAREKALIPAMRIFGVQIRNSLCRTEPAENKRTLFVGNLERGITGQEVAKALNAILKPHLEIELEDVASPGILATSAGYCFIEFDSHQLASMSFSLLSGAVVNGKELKVGWALDSNDARKRRQDYKWDHCHF